MKVNFHLDKKNNPQSEGGVKVVYGQAKRGGYRLRWYLILAIVISPLIAMAYYLFKTQVLVTAPAIITSHPVTINATHPGVVGPIPSDVGKTVSHEQTLLLLSDPALDQELNFIKSELLKLPTGQDFNIEALYAEAINHTKRNLDKVQEIQQNYDTYRSQGQVSEVDYASMVNITNALNTQLSSQKIAYAESKRADTETKLAGPIATEYRSLMKAFIVKRSTQESLTIKAPFAGRVIDIHVLEGERVFENTPLITIAKNATPEITAFLDPKYLRFSTIGTHAKVKYPDGETYTATVSSQVEVVNKLPQELQSPFEGQPAYLKVNLSFDQPIPEERWIEGVSVEVSF
ncbi:MULTISPECIES: HlyD family secretion protein [Vibrio]|uniref:HlyD family secretion protein n=1 Tax=Vibrio TaxID=662 RepID=UPI002074E446|nr:MULTISPECIES: HlyD family secretion protein [Vibrio]USD31532.1 HlyD family efflux transporter periplasmic adaptor subunit [Vibrio sp. SCSIO 43186]USD44576.1 HlyD family efflux transporter periplasmic adaptor subunit [Vibrio sp. SCSIO 43145]USD68655.1 HlyD family efflux transporter periplasmic adaptor subunit [Vibrio sp. SCSIO 43139]USD96345.1 HlyD family secretion protein [Vibrio coralliilyticus]